MDSIVEENGNSSSNLDDSGHNLSTSSGSQTHQTSTIVGNSSAATTVQQHPQQPPPASAPVPTSVLTSVPNVLHYQLPAGAHAHGLQVNSISLNHFNSLTFSFPLGTISHTITSICYTNEFSSIGNAKNCFISK